MKPVLAGKFIAVSFLMAGCVAPPETPSTTTTLPGNYVAIASCVFQHFDRQDPTFTKFDDFRAQNSARVYHEFTTVGFYASAPSRVWEASFKGVGPQQTAIEIREKPTIYGPDFHGKKIMEVARGCAI